MNTKENNGRTEERKEERSATWTDKRKDKMTNEGRVERKREKVYEHTCVAIKSACSSAI